MAQYKLGRIKPVYQGTWTTSGSYVVDDIVTVGGKTYICVISNTASAAFATDLNANPTLWNLIADGSQWKGTWLNSTAYALGDLALYGGTIYQCATAHTSASTITTSTLSATAFTVNGSGTATLTYASQAIAPYAIGSTITLAGFSPTATSGTVNNINTTFTVLTCTTTQLTFALTGTYTVSSLGTVAGNSSSGLENSQFNALTVTAIGSNGTFTCSSTTLNIGMSVVVSGTTVSGSITGYTNPSTYFIVATNGVGTGFTLSATQGGPAIGTSTGTGSGLIFVIQYWVPYSSNINWIAGSWQQNTRYKLNDLITYGGINYICNTPHISATTGTLGLESNLSAWSTFNAGLYYVGNWSTLGASQRYRANDVVTYGAALWICTTYHTATSTFITANFSQLVGGIEYQGAWSSSVAYVIGDIVTYGGNTYTAISNNIGQTPSTSSSNWSLFTGGFSFQGDYVSGSYKVGQVVRLGGYSYVAIADNSVQSLAAVGTTISSDGSRPNQIALASITITAASSTGGTATLTYATQPAIPFVLGQTIVVAGVTPSNFNGTYTVTGTPSVTQVTYALTGVYTGSAFGTVSGSTTQLVQYVPITFSGTTFGGLVSGTQYYVYQIVDATHFTVTATQNSITAFTLTSTASGSTTGTTNPIPPVSSYWSQLNPGVKWRPTTGSFSTVSQYSTTGSGTSATFNITASNTKYTATVSGGGTGYAATDTIRILGTSLGGLSPANDLTITVNTVSSGVIQSGGISVSGISVSWATSVNYLQGDTVLWGVSSYICVVAHTSATGNRPDNDTTGIYWNLLSSGTEQAVLTTQGDMFYYSGNGPARLPLGADGQVLRVNNNTPTWQYYGQINNVVYVSAANGLDTTTNSQGTTIDKPWATVRYACYQIENGYLNTNASQALAVNKQFIIKEVSSYVTYTYQASITGTSAGSFTTASTAGLNVGMPVTFIVQTGSLQITSATILSSTVYYIQAIVTNTSFTVASTYGGSALTASGTGTATVAYYTSLPGEVQRDAGYIVDGLVFDLSHGGTYKTYTNTLAYFNTAGSDYINNYVKYEITQFIGANNYLKTLLSSILSNSAPGTNYQTTLFPSISVTGASGSGGLATITFASQTFVYPVGSQITIAGITTTASAYNGTYYVVSSTNTSVSYSSSTTASYTSGGTVNATRAIQNTTSITTSSIESGALTTLQNLMTIIVNAMGLGNTTQVPQVITPATTISVKTGTYNEILPIIVPAYTAIVGDELRSTVIQPSTAILNLANDKPKSIASLQRISAVLPNLLTNATVTASTGNTTTQITTLPASDTGSQTAVNTVLTDISIIEDMIFNGIQQAPAFSIPTLPGYNTTYLVGFGDGVTQIKNNYNFIKSEIANYLSVNYNAIWTSTAFTTGGYQAETLRDIGFVLDGLQYDMTYGCNNQSIINGSSYYSLNINQITSTYLASTLASLQRVSAIISQIVTATSVTASATSAPYTATQSTSGTAGSAAAAAFAAARIQDVIYWIQNGLANTSTSVVTGSIGSGSTTMTVSAVTSGTLVTGMQITGTGVSTPTYLVNQLTGVTAVASPTYSSGGSAGTNTFVVSSATGILAGQFVTGTNIPTGSYVISTYTTGTTITLVNAFGYPNNFTSVPGGTINFYTAGGTGTYTVSISQTVSSTTLTGNSTITPITSGSQALVSSTAIQNAYTEVSSRITEIASDAQVWVSKYYQAYAISQTLSNRDASLIATGISWDVLFSSNFNAIVIGRAFNRLNTSAQALLANTIQELNATVGAINLIAYKMKTIAASGTVIRAQGIINDMVQTITGQLTTTLTTATTSTNILTVSSTANMQIGMPISFTGLPATISTTVSSTTTSTNVINLPATAASLNIVAGQQIYFTGTVAYPIVPNQMYYVINPSASTIQISLTVGGSAVALATVTPAATMNAIVNNAGNLWNNNVYYIASVPSTTTLTISTSFNGSAYAIQNTVSGMTATTTAGISNSTGTLSSYQTTNGSLVYDNTLTTIQGVEILRANIAFLANESSAYTAVTYTATPIATTTSTNIITTNATHPFVVGDPVQFTATTISNVGVTGSNTNGNITVSTTTGFVVGMPVVISGTTFGGIATGTYYLKSIVTPGTTITLSQTQSTGVPGSLFTPTSTTTGTMTAVVGGIFGGLSVGVPYYVLAGSLTSTTFTISAVQSGQGTQTPVVLSTAGGVATATYYYNTAKCQRDTTTIINALVYDVQFPGNYKSMRAVELYNNAVSGSTAKNMFQVRNASGLRNMTFSGITGTLGSANSFGTKRPTGGAYTSLDPGFGPNDANSWIYARSCYVQNNTMFGYAAVGAKVDAALHNGGNKSMVANDYTTILGDGIGFWVTGSGALAELVSVFNYYGYSGYLSELGGRIRATNGNSSYGTYGVVAEGVDTFETPIYGTLNNRFNQAFTTNVVTDATTQVLRLEYANAGSNYTNAVPTLSVSGYNTSAVQDEFRDSAVFETRLIDLNDSKGTGGSAYLTATNVAQGSNAANAVNGNNVSIVLAATDTALTGAYNGMRVQTTAGTGVGQYANVLYYANGNKEARVIKDTFTPLVITASTNATASSAGPIVTTGYVTVTNPYTAVLSPTGTPAASFVPNMILTSSGTITAGTYITAANTGTLTTSGIVTTGGTLAGTVSAISGTGPWAATVTLSSGTTAALVVGGQITATAGGGTLYGGSPTIVVVTAITSSTVFTYSVTGGTTPTAGTVTAITQAVLTASASSNLLPGMALATISTPTYVAGQISSSGTALATATFTGTSGTSTLTLATFTVGSLSTVAVGQFIGPISGIPANTFITSVNISTSVVTISTTLYGTVNGSASTYAAGTGAGTYALTAVSFTTTITGTPTTGASYSVSTAQNQASATITGTQNTLTTASTQGLYAGMPIYLSSNFDNLVGTYQVGTLGTPTLYYILAVSSATTFAVGTASNSTSAVALAGSTTATVSVTATSATNNLISATNTLTAGKTITFATSFNGIDAGTVYYVLSTNLSASSFSVSTILNGPAVVITTGTPTATGNIGSTVFAGGWDHLQQYPILSALDLTTAYIVEPRINYSAPGYSSTSRTVGSVSATWQSVAYGAGNFVAISGSSNTTAYSTDGKTWTNGGSTGLTSAVSVVYGGGSNATATAVLGGFGGSGAILQAVVVSQQVTSVIIVNGGYNYTTPPTILFTSASGTGATAICTVLNGAIASVTVSINGSNYLSVPTVTAITGVISSTTMNSYGKNYFATPSVTFAQPQGITPTTYPLSASITAGTYYQVLASGRIYLCTISGTTSSTTPTFDIFNTTNLTQQFNSATIKYVATQALGTANLTNAGVSSITLSTTGYGYTSVPAITILDGTAKFVALPSTNTNPPYSTVAGLASAWSTSGTTTTGVSGLLSMSYGNGVYVAVGGTGTTPAAVSSPDGLNWTLRSSAITGAVTYSAVAYGAGGANNGLFVAVPQYGNTTTTTTNGSTWTAGSNLPYTTSWVGVAFGGNKFVALAANGSIAYQQATYITNTTTYPTWNSAPTCTGLPTSVLSSSYTWTAISYAEGLFIALAKGSAICATSQDGINWTQRAMPGSATNWQALTFGTPISATLGAQPLWVALSATSGTIGASMRTGSQTQGRMKVASNAISEVRLVEPGSGYPKGNVNTTTVSGNLITADDTTNLSTSLANNQPIEFTGLDSYNLVTNVTYYVIGSTVTSTQFSVTATAGSSTAVTLLAGTSLAGTYRAGPVVTQIDTNRVNTAPLRVRMGDGALGNVSFTNRGSGNATATSSILGDGYADTYQNSSYVIVSNLYQAPSAGANVQFSSITGTSQWYKLVALVYQSGIAGNYTYQFQINPGLTTYLAPAHNTQITTRLKYSQVRLTGHDFLYIGTGNQTQTNYPYVVPGNAIAANQTYPAGGGRVFFTSTDQDGNFNVGNLFGVAQSTGTASLNASAFNLAGLQSLTLGAVTLGIGSATITQFSTDPYFTANSDNILPTQKAIKSFITAQIGGGSSTLNVNTITAGQILISGNTISNINQTQIYVSSKMLFTGGIDGAPVALAFFSQK